MAQIYLASPFFSDEQVARIEKIEAALTQNPTVKDFFSPRKNQETDNEPYTKPWATDIYHIDVSNIDAAEAVVAIIDFEGEHVDSGTAFEIGYAVQKGTPVVVFHEKTGTVNLMIGESLHAYLKTPEAVAQYDFKTMPTSEYDGKFI
ncbi:nucleoside 2-deoxyribosyltransferase [Fructilactobacillus carniphilus]|uniref:Nucleoside 2-deoxyribosyltransferase n=1 Tax=Fructilactobacillus carniphilus TaxID=2940297 RepID=A0ABY5BW50_9LACO|nr:nucleoside 2-deoxyribosyltransferase [Fructilactobacillus carniphilus]USS90727.1 nucleoside 2-deoxyribosyltransferase [Fructilactobacillus carniphilus]